VKKEDTPDRQHKRSRSRSPFSRPTAAAKRPIAHPEEARSETIARTEFRLPGDSAQLRIPGKSSQRFPRPRRRLAIEVLGRTESRAAVPSRELSLPDKTTSWCRERGIRVE